MKALLIEKVSKIYDSKKPGYIQALKIKNFYKLTPIIFFVQKSI